MDNGRSAYEVYWQSHNGKTGRTGFAELALQMGPGFPVIPTFCENGEVTKMLIHGQCMHDLHTLDAIRRERLVVRDMDSRPVTSGTTLSRY
jgi:hypothetical protein